MAGRALTKSERLREMERLYYQRAYSDGELAKRLGVARTTIFRYRTELEQTTPLFEEAHGHWRLDRQKYLSNIRVNMAEALTLYLAARRASQQTRIAQAHVANALSKLALTLAQPLSARLVKAADKLLSQRHDPARTKIFETVATAWLESKQLRLTYHAFHQENERVHRFSPYLLEPSPWNDGIYLIGQSDLVNQVLMLKLDRITGAELLGSFNLPGDFDEEHLLRYAWGVWGNEGSPDLVQLKFTAGLAVRGSRRQSGTRWSDSAICPTAVVFGKRPLPTGTRCCHGYAGGAPALRYWPRCRCAWRCWVKAALWLNVMVGRLSGGQRRRARRAWMKLLAISMQRVHKSTRILCSMHKRCPRGL